MSCAVNDAVFFKESDQYCLKTAPTSFYYIPNFITLDEEEFLWSKVYGAPKPKWTQLTHRRLQNWGGVVSTKGLIQEQLPEWFDGILDKICQLNILPTRPNHVLVNEYQPGEGIMPHTDGPAYYPVVTNVTLKAHTVLDIYKQDKDDNESRKLVTSILLEPRSLLITADEAYSSYLHGIEPRTNDLISPETICNWSQYSPKDSGDKLCLEPRLLERGTRVSLTIRVVSKTVAASKLISKLVRR